MQRYEERRTFREAHVTFLRELMSLSQVSWIILGPNSREVLPPFNTDFRAPVNGSFFFRDGEESSGVIELQILPHGEVEVEEKFVIELSILSGEMDVDPQAGSVTLQVRHRITRVCLCNTVQKIPTLLMGASSLRLGSLETLMALCSSPKMLLENLSSMNRVRQRLLATFPC